MKYNYVYCIPTLYSGGAERQLTNLALQDIAYGSKPLVIVLDHKETEFSRKLHDAGVEILRFPLWERFSLKQFYFFIKTVVCLSGRCESLSFWMYHTAFFSILVKTLAPSSSIHWMIRRSDIPTGFTKYLAKINALFSTVVPKAIIYNSEAGKDSHCQFGYSQKRSFIIPNGIDIKSLRATSLNKELLEVISSAENKGKTVYGCIARYSRDKGQLELLKAMELLSYSNAICILVGRGLRDNPEVHSLINLLEEENKLFVFDEIKDVGAMLLGFDFYVSPSLTEGFPNIVAEAMALGLPCVATCAGDTTQLVGSSGTIVPVRDIPALADGIQHFLSLSSSDLLRLGELAKKQIEKSYEISFIYTRHLEIRNKS